MARVTPDKRALRTQQALGEALLALMIERGYEKSSVQDILDRACIGRATFYAHFRSKEDLLKTLLDRLREHLLREWKSSSQTNERYQTKLGFSLAFFRHVDEHRKLYRATVGHESGMIVDRQMRRVLADLVKMEIAARQKRLDNTRVELAAQYVVGALMSTMIWWIDRSIKLSAEQIDAIFRQMTAPALDAISSP